jgi:uncharacterized protein YndB with AHSA1/START domain
MHEDQIFRTQRKLPFSPQAIYNAFSSAGLLAQWWGPEGFTNEFETFAFQAGGRWTFVMVGPDGTRYPNKSFFEALEPASRVVIRHECEPFFTLSVRLAEIAEGTHVQWEQVFDDVQIARAVRERVGSANEENLDRLTRVLCGVSGN